ncbi:TPA: 50S ribosomal protein L29 [Candidatus Thalassarchaeaceae archaeon]|nr:50S ribosomal protein L29 [Candidatus Thalassarchaeaceae archaeon]
MIMAHIRSRDLDQMTAEQRERRLLELKEELLQLRAQQALGGSSSNAGAYKQTRRSIARLLTKMAEENKE